jgi:CubicO group peptidase (beta-lactamase class C family)
MRRPLLLLLATGCAQRAAPTSPPPTPAPPEVASPAPAAALVRATLPDAFTDPRRRSKLAATLPTIREIIKQIADADRITGVAYGVVIDGELALAEGLGQQADGAPIDARTRFRIGSITKMFTAAAALQLAEAGRLDLDAPAFTILPELARLVHPTRDARPLTVRDVLTHTAGLPRNPDLPPLAVDSATTRAELMTAIDGLSLVRPPGVTSEYSNLGFSLLGHIVAAVSKVPYRDAIRSELLEPLGMRSTVWNPSDIPTAHLALGHTVKDGQIITKQPTLHGDIDAAGGLFSNIEDLGKFVAFQLAAWPPRDADDVAPLTRATLRDAHALHAFQSFRARTGPPPQSRVSGGVSGVGLGWRVAHACDQPPVVSHNGAVDGYHATIRMLPHSGVGIIVLTNSGWADSGHLAEEIQRALASGGGLGPRSPQALPALTTAATTITALINNWNDRAFIDLATLAWREQGAMTRLGEHMRWFHAALGACALGPIKRATSNWSGAFPLTCERGAAVLTLSLTTTAAPKLASLELTWTDGVAAPALTAAATAALPLLTAFDANLHTTHFSPAVPRTALERSLSAARLEHGACRLGRTLAVQGQGRATFELTCDRTPASLTLSLDRGTPPRIDSFQISPEGKLPACR